jgi:hypothetical protein
VFALGVITLLERRDDFRQAAPLLVVGCLSAVLVFKTPFVFPGLDRIRMPFAFFFAIVLGIGAHRLIRASRTPSLRRHVPLLLFLLLTTTGPLYVGAGDDLYDLHDPPVGPPQKQVEFSEAEYASLAEAETFANQHQNKIQSFWIDALAVERFGGDATPTPSMSESGLSGTEGLFLYRNGWPEHLLHYAGGSWGRFVVSEEWLVKNVRRENQVYDSGTVGLLWDEGRIELEQNHNGSDER